MELVTVKDNQLEIAQAVISELKAFEVEKARIEIKEKELKKALLSAMEEHNIKKFENDDIRIIYVAETVRKSVDSDKLKEQGLYDSFTKESKVKASVRLEIKGN